VEINSEKLKSEAEAIAAEGWKWIEVAITFPYGHDHGLRQIVGATIDLSEEERAAREALRDEYDRLEAEYGEADELPDEIDARLGEIEQALETFERRPMTFEPDHISKAGVFISIDADGELLIERGYVRAEDETPAEPEAEIVDPETGEVIQRAESEVSHMRAVITLGAQSVETEEEDEADTIKPLPDRLVSELTAHRTLALRDGGGREPACRHDGTAAPAGHGLLHAAVPVAVAWKHEVREVQFRPHRPKICAIARPPRPLQTGTNAGAIMSRQTMPLSGIG